MSKAVDTHTQEEAVLSYFAQKAGGYDRVEDQQYWVLSDFLLWTVFSAELTKLPPNFTFLDGGGGTGRWSARVLREFPQCSGVLLDFSPEMTAVARAKLAAPEFAGRAEVAVGRLQDAASLLSRRSFDMIFNFHNVLGFALDSDAVMQSLVARLRPGGIFVSFVPNKYHVVYFNILLSRVGEALMALTTDTGRFSEEMPRIQLFTPQSLRELYERRGLEVTTLTGFPCAIYPQAAETRIEGQTWSIAELLHSEFRRVAEIEIALLGQPDIAARGNNLYAVGVKAS